MALPKTVEIGPLTFRVIDDRSEHNQTIVDDMEKTWGLIRYATGKIILDPDQNDGHKRMCLLHEVMHGCWHIGDRSHKNDEAAIRALAGPLLDVLRRNPDLVAYLTATDDPPTEEQS